MIYVTKIEIIQRIAIKGIFWEMLTFTEMFQIHITEKTSTCHELSYRGSAQ